MIKNDMNEDIKIATRQSFGDALAELGEKNENIVVLDADLSGAINKMVQNDEYCNDILIQLSAIENSVKSLSNHILENHIYSCVADDLENGNLEVIDELVSLFKKFNK